MMKTRTTVTWLAPLDFYSVGTTVENHVSIMIRNNVIRYFMITPGSILDAI